MLISELVCILANWDKHSDVYRLFKQLCILMYIDLAELYFEKFEI